MRRPHLLVLLSLALSCSSSSRGSKKYSGSSSGASSAVEARAPKASDSDAAPRQVPLEEDENLTMEELCATLPCRKPLKVSLKNEHGETVAIQLPLGPPKVVGRSMQIFPGESFLVEGTVGASGVEAFALVDAVSDPERTLELRFEQVEQADDTGAVQRMMMLTIGKNPFDKPLKFRMFMVPLGRDEALATTSCPVRPGLSLVETWPEPIFSLLLEDPRLLGPEDSLSCVH